MPLHLTSAGVTESILYVDDLERAVRFYAALLGAPVIRRHDRFVALRLTPSQVLLLFLKGASTMPTVLAGGTIPPHDGSGAYHICFGMEAGDVPRWEERLRELQAPIESRVDWPSGALSIYFRDPDQHMVELATPGIWD